MTGRPRIDDPMLAWSLRRRADTHDLIAALLTWREAERRARLRTVAGRLRRLADRLVRP